MQESSTFRQCVFCMLADGTLTENCLLVVLNQATQTDSSGVDKLLECQSARQLRCYETH